MRLPCSGHTNSLFERRKFPVPRDKFPCFRHADYGENPDFPPHSSRAGRKNPQNSLFSGNFPPAWNGWPPASTAGGEPMAPRVDPVATDESLPARADVVIIGCGIIGTSAALFLAQRGVSTVLCEKGHIAGEQSSRNWGWCRKMARDPREIPLIIESLRLWQGMNETVEAETGFRQSGIAYLCATQAEMDAHLPWLEHAKLYQLDS